ncbi:MAG: FtsK/SpoIIIE domain-containing protein [Caldilineaceae bacterium]
MITQQLQGQLMREINAINDVFERRKVWIRTTPELTHIAGDAYIVYEIDTDEAPEFNVAKISELVPNLQEALSRVRKQPCPVNVQFMPLALVVDHPFPRALRWEKVRDQDLLRQLQPGQMLAGRNYLDLNQPDEIVDLNEMPQVLIAGMTNSGKSTLQVMMALTLMTTASPEDLAVYVIDLKRDDLTDLEGLPHVVSTAYTVEEAVATIDTVFAIMEARSDAGRGDYQRVVLVIDEMALLGDEKDAIRKFARIAAVGRSKRINIIVAIQKPSAETLGSLGKGNFTLRLVGHVGDPNEAYYATGRDKSGAELLPGRGSFLRVGDNNNMRRFQSYKLDALGVAWLRKQITDAYGHGAGRPARPAARTATLPVAEPQPTTPATPAVPPALANIFATKLLPSGTKFEYGGMGMALRELYGPDAPTTGRAYQDATDEVWRLVEIWKSSQGAQIVRLPLGKNVGKGSTEGFSESLGARQQGAD